MTKDVIESVGKLERVYVVESVLGMAIYDEFCKTKNFSTQMKRVTESRLLPLFRCECLHRFEVEIVVQV